MAIIYYFKKILPHNNFMWISLITGVLGSVLYTTQLFFSWFGSDALDYTVFSFICLLLLLIAMATAYVGQNVRKYGNPWATTGKIMFYAFITVTLFICIASGFSMTLDQNYNTYVENELGFFSAFRMLTQVTSEDVNSLVNWGLGIQIIIKALFLVIPFLICTWGGLSVLTADSIDEAEGGILAIVAAFVVVLIVWLFKLVDVTLGA